VIFFNMDKIKELCPKCLGSTEVISRKNSRLKVSECTYCELDANGKPTGLVDLQEEEDDDFSTHPHSIY
jgi:NMD protein affecting ribosome stability and mRNA decay